MSVGDVNSKERGTGARYNDGKPPFDLIPLTLVAESYLGGVLNFEQNSAAVALSFLGSFQASGDTAVLFQALTELGLNEGWVECAQAFDYGRRKYADWNWAKGMAWSVPLGCAARHLLAIIRGDHEGDLDPESGVSHRGHAFCNIVMLMTYASSFREGDDLPPQGALTGLA